MVTLPRWHVYSNWYSAVKLEGEVGETGWNPLDLGVCVNLAGGGIGVLTGLIMIVGTLRRWSVFLRPIDRIWRFKIYPDAWMKGPAFNERFFYVYHLVGGVIALVVGVLALAATFRRLA